MYYELKRSREDETYQLESLFALWLSIEMKLHSRKSVNSRKRERERERESQERERERERESCWKK